MTVDSVIILLKRLHTKIQTSLSLRPRVNGDLIFMPALLQLYKRAYKGLSKETWFLSLVILINRSGTMVVPFMTMYATQKLGFSIPEAGIIMSFFGIGTVIGTFKGGKITDTIGYHKVQLFA